MQNELPLTNDLQVQESLKCKGVGSRRLRFGGMLDLRKVEVGGKMKQESAAEVQVCLVYMLENGKESSGPFWLRMCL